MAGNTNSGRPRKPTATLKLLGRYREDKNGVRVDESAMSPLDTKPSCLSPLGVELWDSLVVQQSAAGVAKATDWAMAAGMCNWWAAYREADNIKDANIAWRNFVTAAAKFGLSPADRAKLAAPTSTGQSDFDKDMSKHA